MTPRRRKLALVASLLFVSTAAPTRASVLQISGTVRAPNGAPLSGVFVNDGGQTRQTNSAGQYTLQEVQFGTYSLSANRSGLTSATANVTLTPTSPSATKDFTLSYISLLQVPSPNISTASGPNTLTATLRTWAPNPGVAGSTGSSCAKITDSRSGTTTPMIHTGFDAGQTLWAYSPTLSQGSFEGSFTLTARVDDCSSSPAVQLDQETSSSYVIDNKPPRLYGYAPQDRGNCLSPCQRFGVIVSDPRSGVVPSSANLSISLGSTAVFSAPMALNFQNAEHTGFIYDSTTPLTVGLAYDAVFSVVDRAGNRLNLAYFFLVTSISIPTTLASMPPITGTLSASGSQTLATFSDTMVSLDEYQVTLVGNNHPGQGQVQQLVDLTTTTVAYTLSDGSTVRLPANQFTSPQSSPLRPRIAYQVTSQAATGTGSLSARVDPISQSAGSIKLFLPADVSSATLSMDPVATSVVAGTYPAAVPLVAMNAAAVPPEECENVSLRCLPTVDPFPLYSGDAPAAELLAQNAVAQADATASYGPASSAEGVLAQTEVYGGVTFLNCSANVNGGSPSDCQPLYSTPPAPDQDGVCKVLGCMAPKPPTTSFAGPASFQQSDLATYCGQNLACASPDSSIDAVGQSLGAMGRVNNDTLCPRQGSQGGNCGGDWSLWINQGNSVWFTDKTWWAGADQRCDGRAHNQPKNCEITTVWVSFSHSGINSNTDGSFKQKKHGIGSSWDYAPPLIVSLNDRKGSVKAANQGNLGSSYCSTPQPPTRDWNQNVQGNGDLAGAELYNVYQDDLEGRNRIGVGMKFPTFPLDYTDASCVWLVTSGRVQQGYVNPHPRYAANAHTLSGARYLEVKVNCDWKIAGVVLVPTPWWYVKFPVPKYDYRCSSSDAYYNYQTYYGYR